MTSAERELLMSIGSGLLALLQRDTDAGSVAAATRVANALQAMHPPEVARGPFVVWTGNGLVDERARPKAGCDIEHKGTVR